MKLLELLLLFFFQGVTEEFEGTDYKSVGFWCRRFESYLDLYPHLYCH